tara:strand:- start:16 stop:429 length:414 start_codon:yes stop_codon:yes gene_type:complete
MAKKLNFKNLQDINQGKQLVRTINLSSISIEPEEDRLGKLSITVEPTDNNFSFKDISTDMELIENPNILDDKTLNLKNSNIETKDKFDEQEDPFFDLDEQVDKVSEMANNSAKNKTRATISKLGIVSNGVRTRYGGN